MSDELPQPAPTPAPTIPVTPAPAELPPAPGFFGSNQWIAVGFALMSFIAATIFVITGKADAPWWGGFVGTLLPILAGITIGGSAIIKTAQVIRQ